eukprot:SAG25_NODE_217_length_11656_cov_91.443108_12_plen_34_part_00
MALAAPVTQNPRPVALPSLLLQVVAGLVPAARR